MLFISELINYTHSTNILVYKHIHADKVSINEIKQFLYIDTNETYVTCINNY